MSSFQPDMFTKGRHKGPTSIRYQARRKLHVSKGRVYLRNTSNATNEQAFVCSTGNLQICLILILPSTNIAISVEEEAQQEGILHIEIGITNRFRLLKNALTKLIGKTLLHDH